MSNSIQVVSVSTGKLIACAYINLYKNQKLIEKLESNGGQFCIDGFGRQDVLAVIGAEGYVSKTLKIEDVFAESQVFLVKEGVIGYLSSSALVAGEGQLTIYVQSSVSWHCEIYRYSDSKTRVYASEPQESVSQDIPNADFSRVGLKWTPTIHIVEEDILSVPGLYSAVLLDSQGNQICLPFVVNSGEKMNDICVIANVSTWNMYNCWGGRSRYRNFVLHKGTGQEKLTFANKLKRALLRRLFRLSGDLHREDIRFCVEPAWMRDSLSLHRPLINAALLADSADDTYLDHLAGHEWRFLCWLQRKGFSYDYMQDNHLSESQIDLSQYKSVILIGHSEYWQKKDFEVLQFAYEQGVNILNLSGNSLYQQVEYDESKCVKSVGKGFKSTKGLKTIADYFETDLGVKSFSPYLLGINNFNTSLAEKLVGTKTLFSIDILKRSREGYHSNLPCQTGEQVSSMQGASGWEVDKLTEAARASAVVIATGQNNRGGAEIFYIPPLEEGLGVFFSVSSIAFIASLPLDTDLSKVIISVLKGNYQSA